MPIRPEEVPDKKTANIPKEVFEAIDALIVEKFASGRAYFTLKEAADCILRHAPNWTREEIFKKGYLDFEDAYRKAGWTVVFDKLGYNESYEANFTFTAAGPRRGSY